MIRKELRMTFSQVADVERAQQHCDTLGFEIGWLYPGKEIGAVSRDNVAILFRRRSQPFESSIHWYLRQTRCHLRRIPLAVRANR